MVFLDGYDFEPRSPEVSGVFTHTVPVSLILNPPNKKAFMTKTSSSKRLVWAIHLCLLLANFGCEKKRVHQIPFINKPCFAKGKLKLITAEDEFGGFGEGRSLVKYKLLSADWNKCRSPANVKNGWTYKEYANQAIDSKTIDLLSTGLIVLGGNERINKFGEFITSNLHHKQYRTSVFATPSLDGPLGLEVFYVDPSSRFLYYYNCY